MGSRRSFLNKSLFALAGGFFSNKLIAKQINNPLPSLNGRKVLFTYGGWEGHEPEKFRDYIVPWLREEGAEVLVYDSLEVYADEKIMASIDLIIQIRTMSEIKPEESKGLLTAIKNGCGIAGWHGGMCDAFRNNTEYQYMTGGQWVAHPGGEIEYTVKVTNSSDEIMDGLADFPMKSEQYFMHIDPNVKVLATTTFNGENDDWINGAVMPVCWKKYYGKGRVFYTSLGHNLAHVTTVTEAITIIKRGIQWASASRNAPTEKWLKPIYQ